MIPTQTPHFILDEKRKNEIEALVKFIIEEKKAFVQTQYSLGDLSSATDISRNLLSAFFNQVIGVHFNDYLNNLRINACKEMIDRGDAGKLTLQGLAEKCGFHNRNTFTTAFKKFTGVTPSNYIKEFPNHAKQITAPMPAPSGRPEVLRKIVPVFVDERKRSA